MKNLTHIFGCPRSGTTWLWSLLEEFDELVKETIVSKSKEWLGKPKVSMETVEDAYYAPSVKIPTDTSITSSVILIFFKISFFKKIIGELTNSDIINIM